MSGKKGARYERMLVNLLDENGYKVMRSPASGSRTAREQPDILAAKDRDLRWAIEHKYTSKNNVYLTDREVEELCEFAEPFGAMAMVGCRFSGDTTFYLVPVATAHETDTGIGVSREEAASLKLVSFTPE